MATAPLCIIQRKFNDICKTICIQKRVFKKACEVRYHSWESCQYKQSCWNYATNTAYETFVHVRPFLVSLSRKPKTYAIYRSQVLISIICAHKIISLFMLWFWKQWIYYSLMLISVREHTDSVACCFIPVLALYTETIKLLIYNLKANKSEYLKHKLCYSCSILL